jgi:hypothetical protein
MTVLLRALAFAIAIAAFIDPAVSVSGAWRARIALVVSQPAPEAAHSVRDRLSRDLGVSFEVVPSITSDAAAAIVVGDRYPAGAVPDSLLVATVTTADRASGVRILRVDAPRDVPPATAIHLDVELEGDGVVGRTTDAIASIAGLEVGRASHRWTMAAEHWHAGIDAVPVGDPPFAIKVRLKPETTDTGRDVASGRLKPDATDTGPDAAMVPLKPNTTVIGDDASPVVSGSSRTLADVVVDVRRSPLRVEFYDPRPSWATTFVRRALESDPRFQSSSRSFSSRGISAQSGDDVPLGDPRIDTFDVVIAGGLDRLTAADARSLDRFMRERGGAVVLLPDQRIDAGPARDFISGLSVSSGSVRLQPDPVERLLEQPATLAVTPPAASLQASELLVMRALTPGSNVIARVPGGDGAPVIVSMPRGDGRLLLSGAMDAWRFRAAGSAAFDRFWQSTIAGLALAVPPAIDVSVEPSTLRPGETGGVIVRVRSRDVTSVRASLDGNQPIRLRPEPETGVYRGSFTAKGVPGRSTIEVHTDGGQPASVARTLLVQADVQRAGLTAVPALSMLASSHRGIDVTPEHLAELERFLRGAISAPRETLVRHPMRSVWWILPFASCLSAEWWLRRRRGLR